MLQNLPLIEYVPVKIGEPHTDAHAGAIMSHGKGAVPYLIDCLTNESPTKVIEGFQYAVGDVSHRLLCELYDKPGITWPLEGVTPVGGHPEVSFQDYLALVSSPNGRKKLQALWIETIKR